jgi:hypothetical protein
MTEVFVNGETPNFSDSSVIVEYFNKVLENFQIFIKDCWINFYKINLS